MLDTGTPAGGAPSAGMPPLVPPILAAPRTHRQGWRDPGPVPDITPLPAAPGGRMAVMVEQSARRLADVAAVSEGRLVDLAEATQQLMAWAGAIQLELIGELYRRRAVPSEEITAGNPGRRPSRALVDLVEGLARRSTVAEIALATGATEYVTAQKLSAALALQPSPAADSDHGRDGRDSDIAQDPTGLPDPTEGQRGGDPVDHAGDPEGADDPADRSASVRLPQTAAAYRSGLLDWPKVQAIVDATTGLPESAARAVEADAMDRLLIIDDPVPDGGTGSGSARPAPGVTLPKLRRILADAVARHDPDAPEAAERARRERRVIFTPGKDGMTELWALLPAIEAARAEALIRDLAAAAATPDDDRTADQRRADTLLDLLTGLAGPDRHAPQATAPPANSHQTPAPEGSASGGAAGPGPRPAPRPQVIVMIGWETFLGLNDDPGQLSGYGPVPAAMIRDLAEHGTWRCAVIHDQHGTLLGLGRTTYTPAYRPGDALTRHLTIRDRTCTFPGCRQPAHRCDLDHRRPHPAGATCECNLAALCRSHHRLKHEAGFTVRADPESTAPDGTGPPSVLWTTPAGREYRVPQQPVFSAAPARAPGSTTAPPDQDDESPPPF